MVGDMVRNNMLVKKTKKNEVFLGRLILLFMLTTMSEEIIGFHGCHIETMFLGLIN